MLQLHIGRQQYSQHGSLQQAALPLGKTRDPKRSSTVQAPSRGPTGNIDLTTSAAIITVTTSLVVPSSSIFPLLNPVNNRLSPVRAHATNRGRQPTRQETGAPDVRPRQEAGAVESLR